MGPASWAPAADEPSPEKPGLAAVPATVVMVYPDWATHRAGRNRSAATIEWLVTRIVSQTWLNECALQLILRALRQDLHVIERGGLHAVAMSLDANRVAGAQGHAESPAAR